MVTLAVKGLNQYRNNIVFFNLKLSRVGTDKYLMLDTGPSVTNHTYYRALPKKHGQVSDNTEPLSVRETPPLCVKHNLTINYTEFNEK